MKSPKLCLDFRLQVLFMRSGFKHTQHIGNLKHFGSADYGTMLTKCGTVLPIRRQGVRSTNLPGIIYLIINNSACIAYVTLL